MSEQKCTCPIRPGMSKEELIEEIFKPHKNCCHPGYVCPTLDRTYRRAELEADRRKHYTKRLKKQGLTNEEIKSMPMRRRRTQPATFQSVEL